MVQQGLLHGLGGAHVGEDAGFRTYAVKKWIVGSKNLTWELGHRNCVDCVKDYDEVWVPMWLVEGIERNEVTFLSVRASKVLLDWAKSLRLTYPWASRACWW